MHDETCPGAVSVEAIISPETDRIARLPCAGYICIWNPGRFIRLHTGVQAIRNVEPHQTFRGPYPQHIPVPEQCLYLHIAASLEPEKGVTCEIIYRHSRIRPDNHLSIIVTVHQGIHMVVAQGMNVIRAESVRQDAVSVIFEHA